MGIYRDIRGGMQGHRGTRRDTHSKILFPAPVFLFSFLLFFFNFDFGSTSDCLGFYKPGDAQ